MYIPDWQINTQGGDLTEAIIMARDAMGAIVCCGMDGKQEYPQASALKEIPHTEIDIVSLVDIDFESYRRKRDTRAVRRNVSVPSWLNELADENGVNVSGILQDALKQHLHIQE